MNRNNKTVGPNTFCTNQTDQIMMAMLTPMVRMPVRIMLGTLDKRCSVP